MPDRIHRFHPRHDSFVGFDSDGCVLDTVAPKQLEGLLPTLIETWGFQSIEPLVREAVDFYALASRWRGANRFRLLKLVLESLAARPETKAAGIRLPDHSALTRFLESGAPLSQPALEETIARDPDPFLLQTADWCRRANERIAGLSDSFVPFPNAAEAVARAAAGSDVAVLSQSPFSALSREWKAAGLDAHIRFIAGQEHGAKAGRLADLARHYAPARVLFCGDAPGDLQASREAGVLFFPVLPGREGESWRRFLDEGYPRFLAGRFKGPYEDNLIVEFEHGLPETPPWPAPA